MCVELPFRLLGLDDVPTARGEDPAVSFLRKESSSGFESPLEAIQHRLRQRKLKSAVCTAFRRRDAKGPLSDGRGSSRGAHNIRAPETSEQGEEMHFAPDRVLQRLELGVPGRKSFAPMPVSRARSL